MKVLRKQEIETANIQVGDVLCSGSTYGDTFHCMFNRR